MSVHRMRRNDTRPYFRVVIEIDREPIDLIGSVVRFHMDDESGLTRVDSLATIIQTAPTVDRGVVEYRFVPANTGESGRYVAEWEVAFPDGSKQTFPTVGQDRVHISDDLA